VSNPAKASKMSNKPDARLRTLKIKSGIVKRLAKEVTAYEKETVQEQERLQKMKDKDEDEYNIRQQEKVLQESQMMIPDCRKRLQTAYDELKEILESEKDLEESEDFQTASTILQGAVPQLTS